MTEAEIEADHETESSEAEASSSAHETLPRAFGAVLRQRRAALRLSQSDVALASGVGRRFIIELEAGKASCQLGKALVVAEALGVRVVDLIAASADPHTATVLGAGGMTVGRQPEVAAAQAAKGTPDEFDLDRRAHV